MVLCTYACVFFLGSLTFELWFELWFSKILKSAKKKNIGFAEAFLRCTACKEPRTSSLCLIFGDHPAVFCNLGEDPCLSKFASNLPLRPIMLSPFCLKVWAILRARSHVKSFGLSVLVCFNVMIKIRATAINSSEIRTSPWTIQISFSASSRYRCSFFAFAS